jgi:retron-type reverse transcriptase
MKRKGYLFEQICSMPNLLLAAHNAGQGKRQRDEVVEFEKNLAQNLQVLQTELKTRTYTTSAYEIFIKYEPKKREIYKLPYRDRVVQWAILQILEPLWTPTFTNDTYACIRGRGIHSLCTDCVQTYAKTPTGRATA